MNNKKEFKFEKIMKKASKQEKSMKPTEDIYLDLIILANGLREKGFTSEAQDLEDKIFQRKQAEVHLYKAIEDEHILEKAHPEGNVEVAPSSKGYGVVETQQGAKKKIEDIVGKNPTGKFASSRNLKKFAKNPMTRDEVFKWITSGTSYHKMVEKEIFYPIYRMFKKDYNRIPQLNWLPGERGSEHSIINQIARNVEYKIKELYKIKKNPIWYWLSFRDNMVKLFSNKNLREEKNYITRDVEKSVISLNYGQLFKDADNIASKVKMPFAGDEEKWKKEEEKELQEGLEKWYKSLQKEIPNYLLTIKGAFDWAIEAGKRFKKLPYHEKQKIKQHQDFSWFKLAVGNLRKVKKDMSTKDFKSMPAKEAVDLFCKIAQPIILDDYKQAALINFHVTAGGINTFYDDLTKVLEAFGLKEPEKKSEGKILNINILKKAEGERRGPPTQSYRRPSITTSTTSTTTPARKNEEDSLGEMLGDPTRPSGGQPQPPPREGYSAPRKINVPVSNMQLDLRHLADALKKNNIATPQEIVSIYNTGKDKHGRGVDGIWGSTTETSLDTAEKVRTKYKQFKNTSNLIVKRYGTASEAINNSKILGRMSTLAGAKPRGKDTPSKKDEKLTVVYDRIPKGEVDFRTAIMDEKGTPLLGKDISSLTAAFDFAKKNGLVSLSQVEKIDEYGSKLVYFGMPSKLFIWYINWLSLRAKTLYNVEVNQKNSEYKQYTSKLLNRAKKLLEPYGKAGKPDIVITKNLLIDFESGQEPILGSDLPAGVPTGALSDKDKIIELLVQIINKAKITNNPRALSQFRDNFDNLFGTAGRQYGVTTRDLRRRLEGEAVDLKPSTTIFGKDINRLPYDYNIDLTKPYWGMELMQMLPPMMSLDTFKTSTGTLLSAIKGKAIDLGKVTEGRVIGITREQQRIIQNLALDSIQYRRGRVPDERTKANYIRAYKGYQSLIEPFYIAINVLEEFKKRLNEISNRWFVEAPEDVKSSKGQKLYHYQVRWLAAINQHLLNLENAINKTTASGRVGAGL